MTTLSGSWRTSDGRLAVLALDHGTPLVELLEGLGRDAGDERAARVQARHRRHRRARRERGAARSRRLRRARRRDGRARAGRRADRADRGRRLRRGRRPAPDAADRRPRRRGRASRCTADAAKVMVFVRADREGLDGHAAAVTRTALADCAAHGIPCVIEAMTYPLGDESEAAFRARRGDLVREAAVLLEACGAELLKLEYPGSEAACARGDRRDRRARGRCCRRAWATTSSAAQLAASVAGGACGFIAGRSLWKESRGDGRRGAARVPRRRGAWAVRRAGRGVGRGGRVTVRSAFGASGGPGERQRRH